MQLKTRKMEYFSIPNLLIYNDKIMHELNPIALLLLNTTKRPLLLLVET